MDKDTCKHLFIKLSGSWQEMDSTRNVQNFSKERLICEECGKILDAFPEITINK